MQAFLKALALGGNYYRRVKGKNGRWKYFYTKEAYERAHGEEAHVHGPEAKATRALRIESTGKRGISDCVSKSASEGMREEFSMLESTPELREQMRLLHHKADPLAKGLHMFDHALTPDSVIPSQYHAAYIDAFIEEAYEHEFEEKQHSKDRILTGISRPDANGSRTPDEADWWAQWIMHELVAYCGRNKSLTDACTSLNVTKDYVADRIRAMNLVKPSMGPGTYYGNFMEGYSYSEQQLAAGIGKSAHFITEDAFKKSLAEGQARVVREKVVQLEGEVADPFKQIADRERARFARIEALYGMDLGGYATTK